VLNCGNKKDSFFVTLTSAIEVVGLQQFIANLICIPGKLCAIVWWAGLPTFERTWMSHSSKHGIVNYLVDQNYNYQ
jgi:hypothetical protein